MNLSVSFINLRAVGGQREEKGEVSGRGRLKGAGVVRTVGWPGWMGKSGWRRSNPGSPLVYERR